MIASPIGGHDQLNRRNLADPKRNIVSKLTTMFFVRLQVNGSDLTYRDSLIRVSIKPPEAGVVAS
ncbi:MAG: hypothetical protein R3C03_09615 [Pirellulaceae bacterium]